MYHDNIDPDETVSARDMLSARLSLQWEFEDWRGKLDPSCLIIVGDDLNNLFVGSSNALRFRLILSIHYYRLVMLINAPVVVKVLSEALDAQLSGHNVDSLLEHAMPVLRHELGALQNLHQVICTILNFESVFLDQNDAWWLCNYTSECKQNSHGYYQIPC